ncbi:MAG TPA: hypothetical protein VGQ69_11905 [Gemmatimonadales bacterium]|nr:hypothetical protein [Gemmatimonadales bacterium]
MDPWIWVILGGGIALARRRAGRSSARRDAERPALAALALCAGYAVFMAAASRAGAALVERQARNGPAVRTLASPVFGNPLRRRVIRELGDQYELGRLTLGSPSRYTPLVLQSSGRRKPTAVLAADSRDGRRFLRWARFPSFSLKKTDGSTAVTISDLRYGDGANRSWASITVRIP